MAEDPPLADPSLVPLESYRLLGADDVEQTDDPDVSRTRLTEAIIDGPPMAGVLGQADASAGLHGEAARTHILSLLDTLGGALADRSTLPGHLTGSALVIDQAERRVLLMLHAKLGRWLQPGGHADGDHELAGVALREATEETGIKGLRVLVPGIDLDIHRIPERGAEPSHLHLDLRFVVVAPPGAEPVANHESRALRWVDPADVSTMTDEAGLFRLVDRGLAAFDRFSSGQQA